MPEARGSPPTASAGVISSEAAGTARPLGPPGLIERAAPALFLTFWSSGFVAAKIGLDGAEPITFLALRFVIVTALLLAIALLLRRPWPRRPSEIGHLLLIGLVMQALYFGTAYLAFDSGVTAGGLALIVGMQPVVTVILATWWLGERVRPPQIAGLALGVMGVVLVLGEKLAAGLGTPRALRWPACRCSRSRQAHSTRSASAPPSTSGPAARCNSPSLPWPRPSSRSSSRTTASPGRRPSPGRWPISC